MQDLLYAPWTIKLESESSTKKGFLGKFKLGSIEIPYDKDSLL